MTDQKYGVNEFTLGIACDATRIFLDLPTKTHAPKQVLQHLRNAMSVYDQLCDWTDEDEGIWSTECGQMFCCYEGTPAENGFVFCCYCGERIRQRD